MTMKNMWGDLNSVPKVKTPAAYLREQSSILIKLWDIVCVVK